VSPIPPERRFLQHLDRRRGQGSAVGQHSLPSDEIADNFADERQAPRALIDSGRAAYRVAHSSDVVVLKVLPDPGQRIMDRDADALEVLGRADPG